MGIIRKMLFVLVVALPARATDLSDLWWNANESGWGVNVSQQGSTLFLTFFIYDASGRPTWVVASDVRYQGMNGTTLVYTGALYQTTGPWHGGFYSPNQVVTTQVGTVTFTATSVTGATLSYSIGGVAVSKALTRYTFRNSSNVIGSYVGGLIGDATGCPLASANGHFENAIMLAVTGSASNVQMAITLQNGVCTFSGPYTQSGRMGRVQGTIFCSNGAAGTATIFEMEANNSGLTARYTGTYTNGCRETGHFGGVRR